MLAGPCWVPTAAELRIPLTCIPAVSRRGISSVVERETAQTVVQGPQACAKWERMWGRIDSQEVGSEAAILERVRNSSLV